MRRTTVFLATLLALVLALPSTADAKAKMRFKYPNKLDRLTVNGRTVPLTYLDPIHDVVSFRISNTDGTIYSQTLPPGSLAPGKSPSTFKYKMEKNGTPRITKLVIKSKPDPKTHERVYKFKVEIEADLWRADPARNATDEADLAEMIAYYYCGNNVFYIDTAWEFVGTALRDELGRFVGESKGWSSSQSEMTAYCWSECGDNVVVPECGEMCDEGGATPTCNDDCRIPSCGDGNINNYAGEECDPAGPGDSWCELTVGLGPGSICLPAGDPNACTCATPHERAADLVDYR